MRWLGWMLRVRNLLPRRSGGERGLRWRKWMRLRPARPWIRGEPGPQFLKISGNAGSLPSSIHLWGYRTGDRGKRGETWAILAIPVLQAGWARNGTGTDRTRPWARVAGGLPGPFSCAGGPAAGRVHGQCGLMSLPVEDALPRCIPSVTCWGVSRPICSAALAMARSIEAFSSAGMGGSGNVGANAFIDRRSSTTRRHRAQTNKWARTTRAVCSSRSSLAKDASVSADCMQEVIDVPPLPGRRGRPMCCRVRRGGGCRCSGSSPNICWCGSRPCRARYRGNRRPPPRRARP